jgi:hypothetical protein
VVPNLDLRPMQPGPSRTVNSRSVNWRGRSGRCYALAAGSLSDFALRNSMLSIIARGNLVLWVGSAGDVVNDPASRAGFRLALDCADRVFELTAPSDEVQRMTLVWDLAGAEPVAGVAAA